MAHPPTEAESVSRFATLHEESLQLLEDARSLVGEMRLALDRCKRHRPVVEIRPSDQTEMMGPPPLKSHRGGRIGKKRTQRLRRRRPR
ncbi:MAG TPA: hypothetical protein VFI31_19055 [Pirellulales bacterium]|nr:hypothetical protein [Pirellulales bacterium]